MVNYVRQNFQQFKKQNFSYGKIRITESIDDVCVAASNSRQLMCLVYYSAIIYYCTESRVNNRRKSIALQYTPSGTLSGK